MFVQRESTKLTGKVTCHDPSPLEEVSLSPDSLDEDWGTKEDLEEGKWVRKKFPFRVTRVRVDWNTQSSKETAMGSSRIFSDGPSFGVRGGAVTGPNSVHGRGLGYPRSPVPLALTGI